MLKHFETLSEQELINRIRQGEAELFEIIIRRLNPFLYKIGRSYGYEHQDVEDLMQESFIAAYLHLEKFEARSSFKTWITRIMLNGCYRKSKKHSFQLEKPVQNLENALNIPAFQSESSNDINNSLMKKEVREVIETALMKLPVDYRLVFSLRELNDMNTAETAALLNITESNVKVRLNRAKVMLRDKIEKMYSREEIFEFNLMYCDQIVNNVMKKINSFAFYGNHGTNNEAG